MTAMPGTGSDPEIVDTIARRLHLKPRFPSCFGDPTADTARTSSSGKQSRIPSSIDPQSTSEQACPHQFVVATLERLTVFRHWAMAVPATRTRVAGT